MQKFQSLRVVKMENLDVAFLREKLDLDLHFVFRKHWMESKTTEYVICPQEIF